jgi:hypothetical protein
VVDFYEEWASETLVYYKTTGDDAYAEAAAELLRCANECIRRGVN